MGPKHLIQAMSLAVRSKLPIIVSGKPGVGKSEITEQVAKETKHDLNIFHPQVSDPTDFKGFPFPDKDGTMANFLPFGDLAELLNATVPTIAFLDDVGQAAPATQAALMQLVLARRVNGHVLSDKVTFVAATNRRQDLAGVVGLLEPVKSRFATIWELEPDLNDCCDYWSKRDYPAEIIGFVRFRPELLCDFQPSRDLVNSPCPRTISNVGKWIQAGADKLPDAVWFETVRGAAGERFAAEFIAFQKLYKQLPNIDLVVLNPDTAPIPQDPGTIYATCSALASRANEKNLSNIIKYLDRIPNESKFGVELGVFCVKDALARKPALGNTKAFTSWCIKYGNDIL